MYHLVRVKDSNSKSPSLQPVFVVNEFSKFFLDNLPEISPYRETNFRINLLSDTHPISIPPYSMAPTELKELKEQLKNLLDNGFNHPSVSPWGAPVLFMRKKDWSFHMYID